MNDNSKIVFIVAIVFCFFSFLVFCVYKANSEYYAKIEKIIRYETKYLLPDNKTFYQHKDEIHLK